MMVNGVRGRRLGWSGIGFSDEGLASHSLIYHARLSSPFDGYRLAIWRGNIMFFFLVDHPVPSAMSPNWTPGNSKREKENPPSATTPICRGIRPELLLSQSSTQPLVPLRYRPNSLYENRTRPPNSLLETARASRVT